jgi:predicted small metal-binding protein
MRGVECAAPNCAHLHAETDEELVQAAIRHAAEVHPEMPFPESTAREFVQKGAYDDTQHATGASAS